MKINLKRFFSNALINIYPIIILIIIWHLASTFIFQDTVLLPSPYKTIVSFYNLMASGVLFENLLYSSIRVLAGFLTGSIIGLTIGFFMGRIKKVETFFNPIVHLLQPIPKIAWIPLAILWFGLGFDAMIFIIGLATTWPVLFNTYNGVKNVDENFIKVAKSFGAGKKYIYLNVLIPASLPQMLSGLRLGIGVAWRALVAAELLIATSNGLGYMIFHAREFFRIEEIFVGMFTIGIMGLIIEKVIFKSIEKKTMEKWGYYQR